MKQLFFTLFLIGTSVILQAQTAQEALRYSMLKPSFSTARVSAVAGAFGAMGEDMGILNINPAGIASYRQSEFSFTPSININDSDANYNNSRSPKTNTNFGLGSIGYVYASQPLASDWTSSNFSIGLNKQAVFSQQFFYSGDTPSSIVNRWASIVDGVPLDELDDFEGGLAYDANVLFAYDPLTDEYNSDFDEYTGNVSKFQSVTRSGHINELSFAWAGNYKKQFSLGISMGIPILSYETTKIYTEDDPNGQINYFDKLVFTEYVSTSGAGFNFKIGTIYNGLRNFRIGAAIHSPNWYALSDNFYNNLIYDYTDSDQSTSTEVRSPDGNFDYRLSTPWKYIGSFGGLFKVGEVRGFVNADVEYLDYGSSSFNLTTNSSSQADAEYELIVNNDIIDLYKNVVNVRLGSEIGYKEFRLRAGIALDASPYRSGNTDNNTTLGLGVGYQNRSLRFDIGYQRFSNTESYTPYRLPIESQNPTVDISSANTNLLATMAFSF